MDTTVLALLIFSFKFRLLSAFITWSR